MEHQGCNAPFLFEMQDHDASPPSHHADICGVNLGCIDALDYRHFQDVPMSSGSEFSLVDAPDADN